MRKFIINALGQFLMLVFAMGLLAGYSLGRLHILGFI